MKIQIAIDLKLDRVDTIAARESSDEEIRSYLITKLHSILAEHRAVPLFGGMRVASVTIDRKKCR